jgi:hypothetical protein
MLHAGLDLSRRRLDVCLLDEEGNQLDQLICAPDGEALKTFAGRVDGAPRRTGQRCDRVDDRSPLRARHARVLRLAR